MKLLTGFLLVIYFFSSGCSKPTDATPSNNAAQLFVPTAFTPNGDGINDNFLIKSSLPLVYYHIKIYDNTNLRLYESSDYLNTGWDGKTNGESEPAGSYLWSVEYQSDGAPKLTQNGYVQLIR